MIYLASDHGGFALKEKIKAQVSEMGYEFEDCGDKSLDPNDDFVDFASLAASKIKSPDSGIFLCRNGVGVDNVANRYPHLRSVLGFDSQQVERARADDSCNVLSLPSDYVSEKKALQLVEAFLNTKFSGEERYIRRLEKLDKLKAQS